MVKPLSEQLAQLSVQAKKAEDDFAAAKKEKPMTRCWSAASSCKPPPRSRLGSQAGNEVLPAVPS